MDAFFRPARYFGVALRLPTFVMAAVAGSTNAARPSRAWHIRDEPRVRNLNRTDSMAPPRLAVAQMAAGAVGAISLAVILGWTLDIAALKSVVPGYIAMQPWTALCLLFGAVALFLAPLRSMTAQSGSAICALAMAAGAGLPLLEYLSGRTFGTDGWIFPEAVLNAQTFNYDSPGRMSFAAATGLTALAIGLLLAPHVTGRIGRVAVSACATAALALAIAALVQYALRLTALDVMLMRNPLALHSAISVAALALGTLALRPDAGWVAIAISYGRVGWTTAILCGLGAMLILVGSEAADRTGRIAADAAEAARRFDALLSTINDAENNQRGYLLTNQTNYLEPYDAARERLPGDFKALQAALARVYDHPADLGRLDGLVVAKMAELSAAMALAEADEAGKALSLMRSGIGKATMVAIALEVDLLATAAADEAEQRGARGNLTAQVAGVSLTGLMIVFGCAFATLLQRQRAASIAISRNEIRLRLVEQVGKTASFERWLSDDEALISPELNRLYGLPPEQINLSVKEWIARIHFLDREQVVASRKRWLIDGGDFSMAFRICRTDGKLRWVLMHAQVFPEADRQPARSVVVLHDITDVISTREGIINTEARFRQIFETKFMNFALIGLDGTIRETNLALLEATGLSTDELIGKPFWQARCWPYPERNRLRLEIAEVAQGAVIRRNAEINCATGPPRQLDFSLRPLRDRKTGLVDAILAESHDITGRSRA